MITMNSTILSFNKVKEIEEYNPILPPESIYNEEIKNTSFQNFIPDKYDLDKIEFNNLNYERSSTPIAKNNYNLKSLFYNSILISQIDKKEKYIESLPINIYNNEKEKSINYGKIKEIKYARDKIETSNIYQNQKNKIEDDIKNNLNIKKEILAKNNKKNINSCFDKEEKIFIQKNDISTPNLNIDILNSVNMNSNLQKIERKKFTDQKSIQSAITTFNYKDIMRKDPNNENTIIINTSLYKRKKNKNKIENNFSKNPTEIINRNSFNSFLKFEESSKDQRLSNYKVDKNKKEEILKHFTNSNDIINLKNNNKIENNKLNLSNEDSLININSKIEQTNININESTTNLKVEENDNIFNCETQNNFKCNNINNYNFIIGKCNINDINKTKLNNPNIDKNNIINEQSKEINLKLSYSPIKISGFTNQNGQILYKKPSTSSISSNKQFNFDFPKIKEKEYSKDDINNSKDFVKEKDTNQIKVKENKKNEYIIPNINIKFNNLKKVLKKDGFFNILTFLDCYDLMNLLQTNKSLIFLINIAISNAYYHQIKKYLNKYKNDFELLKSSLIYSKVKNALKIDFVINIRFLKNTFNNNIKIDRQNELFNIENVKEMEPKCFQIIYFYKYFKSLNPKKRLQTKENTKKVNMYDYYTYDLYSENDEIPNIYLNKEQLIFNNNNIKSEDKLVFIQPILPFKIKDKGIINLEIYSSNNNFINPSSIKILLKSFELKSYLENLKEKNYNNLRICEYENTCFHWKEIIDERINNINFREIINNIKKYFEPHFEIINISYESIGYFIFKINLLAVKTGKIENKKLDIDFGINLIIRKRREIVENEIKKNNLVLERREIYELRIGDYITLYFSTKIPKKNGKKK